MALLTLITPTYQCATKLVPTIESVLAQDGDSYEYLLVDGESNDGTKALIEKYCLANPKLRSFSEKDKGIYDAMNKGVRRATGRFVYFLGAGDRLRPGVLQAVATEIGKLPSPDDAFGRPTLLYGNVHWPEYRDPYNGRFNRYKILRRNICHQAVFYERSLFDRLGPFNTKYRLLADWEFNTRCFTDSGVCTRYVPLLIADYEGNGQSHTTTDLPFYFDRATLIRRHYGLPFALLLHARFLLTHPLALVCEPWRRVRLLLRPGKRQAE